MDDEEALLARSVARATCAWLSRPDDTDAYRRMVSAAEAYRDRSEPVLDWDQPELLDDTVTDPSPLAANVGHLERAMRAAVRRAL